MPELLNFLQIFTLFGKSYGVLSLSSLRFVTGTKTTKKYTKKSVKLQKKRRSLVLITDYTLTVALLLLNFFFKYCSSCTILL